MHHRSMARLAATAIAMIYHSASPTARADGDAAHDDTTANLDELFEKAQKEIQQGECKKAIPKLEQIERAEHGLLTQIMLGECLGDTGELIRAHRLLSEAVKKASDREAETQQSELAATSDKDKEKLAKDRQKLAERKKRAMSALDSVETRVAKLQIVMPASVPKDAEVKLDDGDVQRSDLGKVEPVIPGSHTVQITAGTRQFVTKVNIGAAVFRRINVPPVESWEELSGVKKPEVQQSELERPAGPAPTGAVSPKGLGTGKKTPPEQGTSAPPLEPPKPVSAPPSTYTTPIVVTTVGVGLLALAVVARAQRQRTVDQLEAVCISRRCPSDSAYLADEGKAWTAASEASQWAGVGLAAVGAALIAGTAQARAASAGSDSSKVRVVTGAPGANIAGLSLIGRFW